MQPRTSAPTTVRAYVLVEAEAGQLETVAVALRCLPHVVAADMVVGPCDLIARIETPDPRIIGRLVIDEFHAIPGIKRTTTCLAVQ
jgi:DNA-binding Lrp family transcriptional regulator